MDKVDKMIKDLDETSNKLDSILYNGTLSPIAYEIPLENVSGVIDKFQEEADARKKDIEDLKFFTKISENAICESFDHNIKLVKKDIGITHDNLVNRIAKNSREIKEEIHEIRKMLISFIGITIFLTIGFIYCIINL